MMAKITQFTGAAFIWIGAILSWPGAMIVDFGLWLEQLGEDMEWHVE